MPSGLNKKIGIRRTLPGFFVLAENAPSDFVCLGARISKRHFSLVQGDSSATDSQAALARMRSRPAQRLTS
jgi:hypothetical protein